MRTNTEIEAEVKKLTEMKPKVRRTSTFGDNNHDAIEAQIEVLTESMDEDEIYDRDWNSYQESSAMDALAWMEGNEDTPPSSSWEFLVVE